MSTHEFLMDLLVIVITVCGALITKYVLPYVKTITEQSKYAELLDIVDTAVKAAEQTITTPKQGKTKKADVVKFVSNWLENKGIHITEDELNRLIEAAVYAMKEE